MSSGGQRDRILRKFQRRKSGINLNLSIGQPGVAGDQAGSSRGTGAPPLEPSRQRNAPVVIDVDALDDVVVISSPGPAVDDEVMLSSRSAFAEARNNSRRVRGPNIVVDVESEEQVHSIANCSKRKRNSSNRQPVNGESNYSSNTKKDGRTAKSKSPTPPPLPPTPPPEPAFSCPICMGQLVEEMTTKCGHIFCKNCIQTAISLKSVCPTCRKKVNKKDVIRIYLPTTR